MSLAPSMSPRYVQKARNHMGYGGVSQTGTFQIGLPAATQPAFMIETCLANLLPEAFEDVIETIDQLEFIEKEIFSNVDAHTVSQIGTIKIDPKAFQTKIMFYRHWQGKLANLLQCPPNPYDQRPFLGPGWSGGSSGINVSVG